MRSSRNTAQGEREGAGRGEGGQGGVQRCKPMVAMRSGADKSAQHENAYFCARTRQAVQQRHLDDEGKLQGEGEGEQEGRLWRVTAATSTASHRRLPQATPASRCCTHQVVDDGIEELVAAQREAGRDEQSNKEMHGLLPGTKFAFDEPACQCCCVGKACSPADAANHEGQPYTTLLSPLPPPHVIWRQGRCATDLSL